MPKSGVINPYGQKYAIGERLDCGCFEVISFNEYLRSKPNARGIDSFIGYIDLGWIGYGEPWVVLPGTHAPNGQIGNEIQAFEPGHKKIWLETRLLSGNTSPGVIFEAYIPGVADRPSPNAWITKRAPVLLRGVILERCDKRFLLMKAIRNYPHDDEQSDLADKSRERARANIARSFDQLLDNIVWKPEYHGINSDSPHSSE